MEVTLNQVPVTDTKHRPGYSVPYSWGCFFKQCLIFWYIDNFQLKKNNYCQQGWGNKIFSPLT